MALLYHGEGHIGEFFSIFRDIEARYPEWFKDFSWDKVCDFFISLEKSHELLAQAGFEQIRLYALHEIYFAEPSRLVSYLDKVFSFMLSFWQEDLPSDIVLSLKNKMVEEVKKSSTNYGFKRTHYNIYAYCTKP